MSDSPTSQPESDFVCDCDFWMRSACGGEPFYKEHEGKRYCVLHFPGKEKSADFEASLRRKLADNDFDFPGVWFPDRPGSPGIDFRGPANFSSATFSGGASFGGVTFSGAAYFSGATFNGAAYFSGARFSAEAYFSGATFDAAANFSVARFSAEANFGHAKFRAAANFRAATFRADAILTSVAFSEGADFSEALFNMQAQFRSATFGDYVRFARAEGRRTFADRSSLDLWFARSERPDRVSFHNLSLRAHWFVNVDARKFDFTNVYWEWRNIKQEIESLHENEVLVPHRLLAIASRNLAVNAEDNNRYEEASRFRYMAMEARRLENWRGFLPWRLSWWYWLASGYGERPFQALMVLVAILVLFGALYTQVGFARWEPRLASEADIANARKDDVGAPLPFSRALTYSAGVLTFQRPEPKPATTAAQTVVLLETILGPVQAALLALAIRRKFMR